MADGEATSITRVCTESARRTSQTRKWGEQDLIARYVCIGIIDYRLNLHRLIFSAKTSAQSLNDLRNYGQRLLGTFCSPEGQTPNPEGLVELERQIESDGGALTGCREAVEILTRNPKKGM